MSSFVCVTVVFHVDPYHGIASFFSTLKVVDLWASTFNIPLNLCLVYGGHQPAYEKTLRSTSYVLYEIFVIVNRLSYATEYVNGYIYV